MSYEKEGFVTVSAAAMEEMADRCFGSGVSLSLPDDFSSVSIQEDGSYLMSLSDMSEKHNPDWKRHIRPWRHVTRYPVSYLAAV